MAKWLVIILLAVLVIACGCGDNHHKFRTPDGWWIDWKDQGTIQTERHSLSELCALFDGAMVRACTHVDTYYGFPAGTCRAKIRKEDPRFELRDGFYFPVIGTPVDAPNAQYASGETMNRYWIVLAFWCKATANSPDPASVPPTAPPWTVVLGPQTGNWYWGEEPDGGQFPALDYELHWFFSLDPKFS